MEEDCILVAAPNKSARNFTLLLLAKGRKVVLIVNNRTEELKAGKLGAQKVIRVKTDDENTWQAPGYPIGRAFIFETSLALTCRYLKLCRMWAAGPIIVITPQQDPRMIYKGLGADFIIHSASGEVGFLANGLPEAELEK
ncbi:hypothetical protein [Paenibacillus sp. DYY-L-2]|uniref:hypothetical protein n=1 Tax=Paenibacillus sp. DYY-L-2 TaxID=3447013 RepID=UPI003F50728D